MPHPGESGDCWTSYPFVASGYNKKRLRFSGELIVPCSFANT
jgi:hypothetical protein